MYFLIVKGNPSEKIGGYSDRPVCESSYCGFWGAVSVGREHQFLMHSIWHLSWVMYTLKHGGGKVSGTICNYLNIATCSPSRLWILRQMLFDPQTADLPFLVTVSATWSAMRWRHWGVLNWVLYTEQRTLRNLSLITYQLMVVSRYAFFFVTYVH